MVTLDQVTEDDFVWVMSSETLPCLFALVDTTIVNYIVFWECNFEIVVIIIIIVIVIVPKLYNWRQLMKEGSQSSGQ